MLKSFCLIPTSVVIHSNNRAFFMPIESEFSNYFTKDEDGFIGQIAIVPGSVNEHQSWCEYQSDGKTIWRDVYLDSTLSYKYEGITYACIEYDPSVFTGATQFTVLFSGLDRHTDATNEIILDNYPGKWCYTDNINNLLSGIPADQIDRTTIDPIYNKVIELTIGGATLTGVFRNVPSDEYISTNRSDGEKDFMAASYTVCGNTVTTSQLYRYVMTNYTYNSSADTWDIYVTMRYPSHALTQASQDINNLVSGGGTGDSTEYMPDKQLACFDDTQEIQIIERGWPAVFNIGYLSESGYMADMEVQNYPVVFSEIGGKSNGTIFTDQLK